MSVPLEPFNEWMDNVLLGAASSDITLGTTMQISEDIIDVGGLYAILLGIIYLTPKERTNARDW